MGQLGETKGCEGEMAVRERLAWHSGGGAVDDGLRSE